MWGNKKPETPQAGDSEPKNVQMNQPPKACSDVLGRNTQDE